MSRAARKRNPHYIPRPDASVVGATLPSFPGAEVLPHFGAVLTL